MHLAIVTPFPPTITGVAEYAFRLSSALAGSDAFNRVTLLTELPPGFPAVEDVNLVRVERIWNRNSPWVAWRILMRLDRLAPDVIWFNVSGGAFGTSVVSNAMGLF